MPAVSRHLKVLERAALISRTRSGKWRECHLFIRPILVGGAKHALPGGLRTDLELLDDRHLGNGVVSLRYGIPN